MAAWPAFTLSASHPGPRAEILATKIFAGAPRRQDCPAHVIAVQLA